MHVHVAVSCYQASVIREIVMHVLCLYVRMYILYMYISFFPVTEMDYVPMMYGVPFSACDVVKCVNVTIHDDSTLEMVEMLYVRIILNPRSAHYTFSPVTSDIVITDNESKVWSPSICTIPIFPLLDRNIFHLLVIFCR